jgi:hypothetical protein
VVVSFTPLLYFYKKDCGSVKASWTKDDTLLRDELLIARRDPTGSFQSHSGVEEASLQKAGGN